MQKIFESIYFQNSWQGEESKSGPSSGLATTKNLREALPQLIQKYSVRTILDAPCGDFFWMKECIYKVKDLTYIGADIVQPMIEELHQANEDRSNVNFLHLDIVNDELPEADMMICRDFLFHMSYSDANKFINNFIRSGIPYLLTTSHDISHKDIVNNDIATGQWKWMDLFGVPYNFPANYIEKISDGWGDRYLYLWEKSSLENTKILNPEDQ